MPKCKLDVLLSEIRQCTHCKEHLPLGPNPVVSARRSSQILIVGQAPGVRVHHSGIPWDDPSGQRLRQWMGIDREQFYDANHIAIVPMGFCYPGTGDSGDLPPRPECAELWHDRLLSLLPNIQLTLVMGQYAQKKVLGERFRKSVTETVTHWQEFTPSHLPLPHPSPRNNRWLKKHPWFEEQVIPWLQQRIQELGE